MVISIPKTSICLSVAVSLLFISSSLSISHLIRLASILSCLGHFLIPAGCIHVLPFSVKSHSSYLCLYPLYPPTQHLPSSSPSSTWDSIPTSSPLPAALPFNPSNQMLTHFPLCFLFLGWFESPLVSIYLSLMVGDVYNPFREALHNNFHHIQALKLYFVRLFGLSYDKNTATIRDYIGSTFSIYYCTLSSYHGNHRLGTQKLRELVLLVSEFPELCTSHRKQTDQ